MATKLRNLQVEFGSLVDKGANPGAHVLLFKRDGDAPFGSADDDGFCRNWSQPDRVPVAMAPQGAFKFPLAEIEKVGRKMAGKRLAQFKSALETLAQLLNEINDASDPTEDSQEVKHMSKKNVEAPAVEQVEASADIEKAAETVTEKVAEPVADEAISKAEARIVELTKRLDEAERIAKAERDARLTAEWVDVAKSMPNLTADPAEFGPVLKRIAESAGAEDMAEIQRVLRAADEQVSKSKLLEPVGKSGADDGGSAWAKVEALAKAEIEKNAKLSIEKARVAVLKANPTLRDQYYNERGAH